MAAVVATDPSSRSTQAGWRPEISFRNLYLTAFALWLASRVFVLLHQGNWPWMNFFVVETARGMLDGNWDEAFRPALPSLLAMPFVALGASDLFTVGFLYLAVSLVQFWAFTVLVRRLFPDRVLEQGLALVIFLLVPMNHSIHHWRNMPVVLASSAVFLLGAHFIEATRRPSGWATSRASIGWAIGSLAMGLLCRSEVATFAVVLLVTGWLKRQPGMARLTVIYVLGIALSFGATATLAKVAGADEFMQKRYGVHTFLDSTPSLWLTSECRLYPNENCREDDGWLYFGPRDMNISLTQLILNHPWLTVWKTVQSALDNLWELFGRNISTYPTYAWLAAVTLVTYRPARQALAGLDWRVWAVAIASLSVTVLPPLSWAPAHPQYHLHSLAGVAIIAAPLLASLAAATRGQWYVIAFLIGNAALSAFRYTRYPGY
jgi:hypothetical protein